MQTFFVFFFFLKHRRHRREPQTQSQHRKHLRKNFKKWLRNSQFTVLHVNIRAIIANCPFEHNSNNLNSRQANSQFINLLLAARLYQPLIVEYSFYIIVPFGQKNRITGIHFMDKIFSKFEHVGLGTRVVYYKNRSFSRKAVLFGKVLVQGKLRFTLSSVKCRLIHQFALSVSTTFK